MTFAVPQIDRYAARTAAAGMLAVILSAAEGFPV